MPQTRDKTWNDLKAIWDAGIERVKGEHAMRQTLNRLQVDGIKHLLAVGKAAGSMVAGCQERLDSEARVLVLTKYGHSEPGMAHSYIEVFESSHPVPDQNSLEAGRKAKSFVGSVPEGENLVMLVSGGASALVESLKEGITLETLRNITEDLVSASYSIDQINAVRTCLSQVKGGQLLNGFGGSGVQVFAISDVPTDDIRIIGSGVGAIAPHSVIDFSVPKSVEVILENFPPVNLSSEFAFAYDAEIVASNDLARIECAAKAEQLGYHVTVNDRALNQDVLDCAGLISRRLIDGDPGVYIWGGEPTVNLPENPGSGGRNQHLALLIAREISGRQGITVLVGGTDGTDGPTDAAGGVVDGFTFDKAGESALDQADSGTYLDQRGCLLRTGPTGTNVMDLVIGIKG